MNIPQQAENTNNKTLGFSYDQYNINWSWNACCKFQLFPPKRSDYLRWMESSVFKGAIIKTPTFGWNNVFAMVLNC